MIRVGFTVLGGANWTGGHNYLLNLFKALTLHERERLTCVLFAAGDCPAEQLRAFEALDGVELVRTDLLNQARRSRSLMEALLLGRDRAFEALLEAKAIDVVFEAGQFFGWQLSVPALAWVPDFQHRFLPRFFSKAAWLKREIGLRAQFASGRTIMVSSDDARRACERFYPATIGRVSTVHFAVPQQGLAGDEEIGRTARLHGLPDTYVFMPNQFWQHKNHRLVLDALTILRDRGRSVVVAASGKQHDPRRPEYFAELKASLEQSGLEADFRLLGVIPYDHVRLLMQGCAALLNPSLFEGWSTTVEEARSFGTPMILSDLPVHQEQMGEVATYFDRHSAEALTDALAGLAPVEADERRRRAERAGAEAQRRFRRFAAAFADLAAAAAGRPAEGGI